MLYKATFSYTQSSPRGGSAVHTKEVKLIVAESETQLVEKVESFLSDDKCGYRKFIELVDIQKI